ncbi:MAG: hypothetical protein EOO38_28230 [Cytophagaceae bacterium]|nr:MAG: hypothetical protein EOO38_28230 [Cytophagaceae bacterium]
MNTERVFLQEHHSVHVGASEEALLNRCSWLAPLDNMLSDGTREPWKTPFAPAAPHDKHYVSQPLTSACFAMPPLPITGFEDQTVLDRDPAFEVTWAGDGSDMPRNWPAWYRGSILACVSFATLVV